MRPEFVHGIQLFNAREFFECHEVLEALWMESARRDRFFLQSIIHLAVGFYHHRRGNQRGAVSQLTKGVKKLAAYLPRYYGLDTRRIYVDAAAALDEVHAGARLEEFPVIFWVEPIHSCVP